MSPVCPSTPTHHTWMLGLERYKLPQGGHVGRLVGGHWRRGWVQDVMVAGDDGGECLVGDGKLLHGTCLNQLWGEMERKTRVRHPCPLPRASKGPCALRNLRYSGLGCPHHLWALTAQAAGCPQASPAVTHRGWEAAERVVLSAEHH